MDLELSIKTVKDVNEAIAHINRFSTHHSEAIIAEDTEVIMQFLAEVDSACVYVSSPYLVLFYVL